MIEFTTQELSAIRSILGVVRFIRVTLGDVDSRYDLGGLLDKLDACIGNHTPEECEKIKHGIEQYHQDNPEKCARILADFGKKRPLLSAYKQ